MLLNRDDNDSINVFQDSADSTRISQESLSAQIPSDVGYAESARPG